MIGTCYTCKYNRRGNLHRPDGTVEKGVSLCVNRKVECEPGLNTYWRPVE